MPPLRLCPSDPAVLVVRARELPARLFVTEHSEHAREVNFPQAPVLSDPQNRVADAYNARVVPYIVVVDAQGRIAAKGSGFTLGQIGNLLNQADRLEVSAGAEPNAAVLAADGFEAASRG